MKIHNLFEEEVATRVDNMYAQAKKMNASWLKCDCQQCRLDTTCYVLNRLQPKYIVSGRGVTHVFSEKNRQTIADMEALILEAMKIVSSVQRPYHNNNIQTESNSMQGDVYNFPTFVGSVFDGFTFEPLENAEVSLKLDGKLCSMIDFTWANPCTTRKSTKGTYSFLVQSEPATEENKTFSFTVEVKAKGYESLAYTFSVPVFKENDEQKSIDSTYSLKLKDLFLFPAEDDDV